MEVGKDELGVIATIAGWVLTIGTFGYKGRGIVSRVEVLETDMTQMKQATQENSDKLSEVSRSYDLLVSQQDNLIKIFDLRLEQMNKEISRINSDFKNYQDINNDTLKAFASMYQQQTEGLNKLNSLIASIPRN